MPLHVMNEQKTFTDGRILLIGGKARRGREKRADYLLRYTADLPIAVVEAKALYKETGDGPTIRMTIFSSSIQHCVR